MPLDPIYYLEGFEVTKLIKDNGETEYRIIYPGKRDILGEVTLIIPPKVLLNGRSIITQMSFGKKEDDYPDNWEKIAKKLLDKAAEITFWKESLPNMIIYFEEDIPSVLEKFHELGFTYVDHQDKFLLRNVFLEEIRGKQRYDEKVTTILFIFVFFLFLSLLYLQWVLFGEIRL